jgi:hypothetical protein
MLSGMDTPRFESFEEFWPFYVKEHAKKGTRILHFIGTTAAMACVAGGILTKRRWLLGLAPVVGYGHAWIGHFFIEGNKPATFAHPLWSLRGDLVMWSMMVRGKMSEEVERVLAADAAKAAAAAPPPPGEVRVEPTVN